MWNEFKAFVMRGNVVDLAVGVVIGAAFGTIVTSFTSDVLLPPVGLVLGGADFSNFYVVLREGIPPEPYASLAAATEAGAVTLNYGAFITVALNFLLVAGAVFLVVKGVARLHRTEPAPAAAPSTRACPFCVSTIAIGATRCPHCTSDLRGPEGGREGLPYERT